VKERFFQFAKECALNSDFKGASKVKVGCVIVWKNTIIAKSSNLTRTSPAQYRYNKLRFNVEKSPHYYPSCVHAEMAAISKIKYLDIDFSKVDVYVYRELKDGTRANARPCPACEQAMRDLGIKHVCYTMCNSYIEEWYT